ncbi:hypothetical protein D3C84_890170 [compost metagenome]
MAHQGHGQGDDAPRQATSIHQLAGEHEEWNGQQREAIGAADQVLREDLCIEGVELHHQCHAGEQQSEGHWDAQGHGSQQGAEEYGDSHGRDSCSKGGSLLRGIRLSTSAWRNSSR